MLDLAFFPPEKSVLTGDAHTAHDIRQKSKSSAASLREDLALPLPAGPALADDACAATRNYRPK
jgi:hypothetical protein